MKEKKTTHKLEYYVPESVRMLRILHGMEENEGKENIRTLKKKVSGGGAEVVEHTE